jgi:hypothetical protein
MARSALRRSSSSLRVRCARSHCLSSPGVQVPPALEHSLQLAVALVGERALHIAAVLRERILLRQPPQKVQALILVQHGARVHLQRELDASGALHCGILGVKVPAHALLVQHWEHEQVKEGVVAVHSDGRQALLVQPHVKVQHPVGAVLCALHAAAHHGQLHGAAAQRLRLNAHVRVEVNVLARHVCNGAKAPRQRVVLAQVVAHAQQALCVVPAQV